MSSPADTQSDAILAAFLGHRTNQQVAADLDCTVEEVLRLRAAFEAAGRQAVRPRRRRRAWARVKRVAKKILNLLPLLVAFAAIIWFSILTVLNYPTGGSTAGDDTTPAVTAKPDAGWQLASQKGDFWGGHVAAAGSIAGTSLFLLALIYQREELKLTRKEMKLTRKEMQDSRAVAESQLTMAKQTAAYAQLMELIRQYLEAEARFARSQSQNEEETTASLHKDNILAVLNALLLTAHLPEDVKCTLQHLVKPADEA